MQRVLFATIFSFMIAMALPAEARKWTSEDGRYSIEAELVQRDDANVTLKKRSGETVTVPLERLSEADRRYLLALKKEPTAPKENVVSYAKDVQPFLTQYCAECHRQDKASDGYDVTSYATLTRRGSHGVLVVPGKPDVSRLSEVLQGMSKSMPPGDATQPPPEETAKIVAWVKAGAMDDSQQPPAAGKARASGRKRTSRQTP
jgi:mono/diheme cytochrome c family protein